jgi:hypothetical protein
MLLGTVVELALDPAPVGIGGEDEPLAGRPQFFDLEMRPSLQQTTSSARREGKLSVIASAASSDRAPGRSGGQPPDALACWRRSPVLAAVLASSQEESNERKGAGEMRRHEILKRLAGLIAVFMLAAGITAGSAQTEDRRGHGKRAGLELTYTKWFEPGFPHMVGVVGGDIDGTFGGAVLEATQIDGGFQLTAIYIVVDLADPSRSLTIRVKGAQLGNTAVLNGRVVDGSLKGARARAEFTQLSSCTQTPRSPCFQGTISIKPRDDD